MADDDWFGGGDDAKEPTPPPAPALKKKGKAKEGKKEEEKEPEPEKPVEEAPPPPPEAAEEAEFLDPDRLLLCKHWIRPRFLQYKYLFDYRHNYYDDVIDYLDKRNKGLRRDAPRPQTWAERALRTFSTPTYRADFFKRIDEDKKLATVMRLEGAFYHYHTREYFNRKYSSIL